MVTSNLEISSTENQTQKPRVNASTQSAFPATHSNRLLSYKLASHPFDRIDIPSLNHEAVAIGHWCYLPAIRMMYVNIAWTVAYPLKHINNIAKNVADAVQLC